MLTKIRTGKELILATKKYAFDDTAASWWAVLSTGGLLLLTLAGTLWNFHPAAKLACSILSGMLVLRFFVIYHDHQHHAILPRSRVCNAIMTVFGILAVSPSSIWKSSHNHHHSHNSKLKGSHIGSFPIMTKAQFLKSPRAKRFKYLFMRHPLTILFGYVFIFLFGMCLYPFLNHPKRHFDSLVSLLVHVGLGALVTYYFGWQGLLLCIVIPEFIACGIGSYLFYAQHNFPGVSFSDYAGWTHEKAALESSSFMQMGPVMHWFTANIGYHHLHHLNARIPFHKLPQVMSEMPELQNPRSTSLSPANMWRCLRLKVWDVDAQKMVSLN